MEELLRRAATCIRCTTRSRDGKVSVLTWCQPHEAEAQEISILD